MTVEQTFETAGVPSAVGSLRARRWIAVLRGSREIALLGLVYFAYSMVRLMADDSLRPAIGVAHTLLTIERALGIDIEAGFNEVVASSQLLSLTFSFWYASAHFVVTAAVLFTLYHRRPGDYARLRSILALATLIALVIYLALPTAPPRLTGAPYLDVLVQTADHGWWGAQVSVPGGWGEHTNELAALPSMHAGWSLWVALAVLMVPCSKVWKIAGVIYALTTATVVVGTGNHWTLDVLAGWVVVLLAAALLRTRRARTAQRPGSAAATQHPATRHPATRHPATGPEAVAKAGPEVTPEAVPTAGPEAGPGARPETGVEGAGAQPTRHERPVTRPVTAL